MEIFVKLMIYIDGNIPEIFKKCLKSCFDEDINKKLIDRRITSIKPKFTHKIYDYQYLLKKYFTMNEKSNYYNEYLPLSKKREAAEYLIRIIPKENMDENKNKNNDDLQNSQRKLFQVYQFFTGNDSQSYEIERNEYNYINIWNYSNKYIYDIIIEIIEKYNDINSLYTKLNKSKELIIEN